jgi:Domain of unknown function (DUF4349)
MRIARQMLLLAILSACHRSPGSDAERVQRVAQSTAAPRPGVPANAPDAVQPLAREKANTPSGGAVFGNAEATADAAARLPLDSGAPTTAMIVRTGTASVEVGKLDPAIAALRDLAHRAGGYVGTTSVQSGHEQSPAATLELRVPSARFDELVTGLKPLGQVEYVNIAADDVGEEFVDISARAGNARRLEERLVGLLATRTGKLSDVLAVERELARVREEIERYDGRLRYLRSRSAVSTLSVAVHEPRPIVGEPGQNPIAEALRAAWRNSVSVVAAGIAGAGYLAPLALLAATAIFLVRRNRLRSPDAR